ncbi:MAG: nickel pincer cofactor biosynthesis protein LarC [Candidatus Koribacter versatilis]|nr:nickel pincer cofactor biosynthesis protein LarC [Candidatus Koribacter versatilis]
MRIAYLDCFSGISGDMFLGALVDTGVSRKLLEETVSALDIGVRLEISRVVRGGIAATKVDVYSHGEKDLPREVFWEQQGQRHSHGHPHEHRDHDRHEHTHDRHDSVRGRVSDPPRTGQRPVPTHSSHVHGRSLKDIRQIIGKAAISNTAKAAAIRIFEALGKAEAEIHNTSIENVHFHEVGAVDAIVDIVCAAVGAEALGVNEWICSPLNVGGGTVECAHGTLPVPAPATLKLLKDAPVYSSGPQVELVTPTGAAIVKTLAARFGSFPAMKIEQAGYGAGSRDFHEHPNLLRLTVGEAAEAAGAHTSRETINVLEANLDDLSPQVLAYAMEKLLTEGALDVFSVPVQMKKGRPGALLTVLCNPEHADRLTKLIFAETTTLGVRCREEQRQTLARRWETVKTSWGDVRIKIASMNGSVSTYAPEYEDCRALAEANHVPLKLVLEEAMRKYGATGS